MRVPRVKFCTWPEKRCGKCHKDSLRTFFSNDKTNIDGKSSWCKTCTQVYNEAYKKKNPQPNWTQADKDRARQKKYGMSPEAYADMLKKQDYCCAVCGTDCPGIYNGKVIDWPIDHDHGTGKPRAALCTRCNTAVGLLKDNPETAWKMAEYLEAHKHVDNDTRI